jgi:hypothetical protein
VSREAPTARERVEQELGSLVRARVIGPQPHPGFVEVFCQAAFGEGERAVAGAGEGGAKVVKGFDRNGASRGV